MGIVMLRISTRVFSIIVFQVMFERRWGLVVCFMSLFSVIRSWSSKKSRFFLFFNLALLKWKQSTKNVPLSWQILKPPQSTPASPLFRHEPLLPRTPTWKRENKNAWIQLDSERKFENGGVEREGGNHLDCRFQCGRWSFCILRIKGKNRKWEFLKKMHFNNTHRVPCLSALFGPCASSESQTKFHLHLDFINKLCAHAREKMNSYLIFWL